MELKDKRIVITGGASGLGLEMVRQLYQDNELIVIARPSPGLERLQCDFPEVAVCETDLADSDQVARAVQKISQAHGRIDVLINNAAIQNTPGFRDPAFDAEAVEREINVNFLAPVRLCAGLLPLLEAAEDSLILNINSGLALMPKTASAVYCGTKGGLNIFSQSLSYQLENTSVRVAQAFLPLVDTPMTRGRGRGKLSPGEAVSRILQGVSAGSTTIDIGKVRLLRPLIRLFPSLARKIMKSS